MSIMKTIKELKKYLLVTGITQRKAAREMGVAHETISRWFNNPKKYKPGKMAEKMILIYIRGGLQ